MLEMHWFHWSVLVASLFISSFGVFWLVTTLLGAIIFILGVLCMLYVLQGDVESFLARNRVHDGDQEGGLPVLLQEVVRVRGKRKQDTRVTGSDLIDNSLQEILGYLIRDYVEPWYCQVSRDVEFSEVSIRQSAQSFAVNISNQIKEVDWIPYLTTRFVDDAATHLRLFKQARNKTKIIKSVGSSPRNSPRKTQHKRNKSETDAVWYAGPKKEEKSKFYSPEKEVKKSLEEHFFDLEFQLEKNLLCRDTITTKTDEEKEFLCELFEVLLYILMPEEDFNCKPLRFLFKELLANCVALPLIDLLSDPDYINQAIIWLCLRESQLPSDIFLSTLRLTDNADELKSTKDLVLKEMQVLRSRDSGGEADLFIKQQLSSLGYVLKLIDTRLLKLNNEDSSDYLQEPCKTINLTLEQIMSNNVALSYFIDYVSHQNRLSEIFFLLAIEGWKISVQQVNLENQDTIRSSAADIFEQFLGENSEQKVLVKQPNVVQKLHFKIRNLNESPNEGWFDEMQQNIYEMMSKDAAFLPGFLNSRAYIKLLHELELVPQTIPEEESLILDLEKNVKHARSFSDVSILTVPKEICSNNTKEAELDEASLKKGSFVLAVNIIETGIVCEKGKTFGIYAIRVSRQYESGFLEEWHIYRRYSDFHDLYTKVKEKFPDLSKIPFPAKKAFHNMERQVLERRMKMLGLYMNQLCQSLVLDSHHNLRELLLTFLEQGEYDRATGGPISSTINTLVNPLKSGMKTIKNMPEQLINTVDEMVEGITRVFNTKPSSFSQETSKVGASIEETDDNIPLRIMLLLMDEVFDLKSRNQWLRRRIVIILRQIIRTMFGDIVNRRILQYVSLLTSPKNVAHYLCVFKQSFWPNGLKSDKKSKRDSDTKNRTRIAAKVALLSCLSDELKHIIGSETTRRGLITIFELFQKPILNRRLFYVLVEGVLCTMFPERNFQSLFLKLYSKSERLRGLDQVGPVIR